MTREKMIEKMMDKANELINDYSKMAEMEIWRMCFEWNDEHEDEEIFMCEYADENNLVVGFYIEDDYWIYGEH